MEGRVVVLVLKPRHRLIPAKIMAVVLEALLEAVLVAVLEELLEAVQLVVQEELLVVLEERVQQGGKWVDIFVHIIYSAADLVVL